MLEKQEQKAITLISLIITIMVMLILSGLAINLAVSTNGIFLKAKEAKLEMRGAIVEETRNIWKVNVELDKHTNSPTAQKLEDLIEDLVKQQQLTEDEKDIILGNETKGIEAQYKITIGSHEIDFNLPTEAPKKDLPIIEESKMFDKSIGVIDIVWLNIGNNVTTEPMSPKNYLGGLTPVKYSDNKWVEADKNNTSKTWYNYQAQSKDSDGKTSNWANAVANYTGQDSEKAYFVWIPRYAYKITYFKSEAQAKAYKETGSTEGIVGYSNIYGMVKIEDGVEKLIQNSQPTNVKGAVKTEQYSDYIPHPAFEFDGSKAGIWVGKFECSGSEDTLRIIPNVSCLQTSKGSNAVNACKEVKKTYNLELDSHMMKNIEWGAVTYLAESKYGRNGHQISLNQCSNKKTGAGRGLKKTEDSTKTGTSDIFNSIYSWSDITDAQKYNGSIGTLSSTTGNVYGIYDLSGGGEEIVASVYKEKISSNIYFNFTSIDSKYYDTYTDYNDEKRIKGNAIYETSVGNEMDQGAWQGSSSLLVTNDKPILRKRSDIIKMVNMLEYFDFIVYRATLLLAIIYH